MANILLHFAFVSAIVFGVANSFLWNWGSDNLLPDNSIDAVDEYSDADTCTLEVIIQSLESIKKIADDNAEVRSVLEKNGLIAQQQFVSLGFGSLTTHPETKCHIQIIFQSFVPEVILQYMAKLSYEKNHIERSNDGKYDLNFPFFKRCQAKDIMEGMFEGLSYGEDCNEYHLIIGILDHIRFNLWKDNDERNSIVKQFENLEDFIKMFDEASNGPFKGEEYTETIIQSISEQGTLFNNDFIEDLKTVSVAEKLNEDWKGILVCDRRLKTQNLEDYLNHDEVEHHELIHTWNYVDDCPHDGNIAKPEKYDLCTERNIKT